MFKSHPSVSVEDFFLDPPSPLLSLSGFGSWFGLGGPGSLRPVLSEREGEVGGRGRGRGREGESLADLQKGISLKATAGGGWREKEGGAEGR